MKLIESTAKEITLDDWKKRIEYIGRICYKSEDKITETSCNKFIDSLISNEHYAMLEHARVYCIWDIRDVPKPTILQELHEMLLLINIPGVFVSCVSTDLYLISCSISHLVNPKYNDNIIFKKCKNQIIEKAQDVILLPGILLCTCNWSSIEDYLYSIYGNCDSIDIEVENLKNKHVLISIEIICDRGVSHEFVRHRLSFAQESTRYCNYSKSKFGGIQFIEPASFSTWSIMDQRRFTCYLENCEIEYLSMIERGFTPEIARAILPNALKTTLVISATRDQWNHIIDIRYKGLTGEPHPDMKNVCEKINSILN